jgi:hypothetical protein
MDAADRAAKRIAESQWCSTHDEGYTQQRHLEFAAIIREEIRKGDWPLSSRLNRAKLGLSE